MINGMGLSHPKTIALHLCHWKNCLPLNRSLVPRRLGTSVLEDEVKTPWQALAGWDWDHRAQAEDEISHLHVRGGDERSHGESIRSRANG